MEVTKEVVHANIFNNGFDTNFTFGANSDGKPLFSASHLNGPFGADGSNLITAADLSETTLEDMVIDIMEQVDPRGLKQAVQPVCLLIPPNLNFVASRVLDSTLQNDTADNAVNVLKLQSTLPQGVKVNPYLTDTDAWYVITDVTTAGEGLVTFNRWPLRFTMDNDFDTTNMKCKALERFVPGVVNWRGVHGSAGA